MLFLFLSSLLPSFLPSFPRSDSHVAVRLPDPWAIVIPVPRYKVLLILWVKFSQALACQDIRKSQKRPKQLIFLCLQEERIF